MTAYGIDFGTTNSAVAVFNDGNIDVLRVDSPPIEWDQLGYDKVFPSVFGYGENREPLFGWEAKLAQTETKIEAVKRLFATEDTVTIGDEHFLVDEVATMLFAQIKRSVAAESGIDLSKAVVTIPANSRGRARQRTKLCAGMGGVDVLALINEPTAAAMAATRRNREDQTVMVIDWGGGTLDVTVLVAYDGVFMEQSSHGIQSLGGVDFDSMLMKWLTESTPDAESWSRLERTVLRLQVEKAKVLLSENDEVNIPLPDGGVRRLTRAEFDHVTESLLERSKIPIAGCLRDLALQDGEIDTLVLAGGTCKIPAVRVLTEQLVGQPATAGLNPLTVVAEGAAIASAIMQGELEDYEFYVSTEHALGTVVLTPDGGLGFTEVIPRNHKLPAEHTEVFVPVLDDQESVNFRVIEGDPNKPINDVDNVILAEWIVPIPNPGPAETMSFAVTYKYDIEGIVHVELVDQRDGSVLHAGEIAMGVQRDPRRLVEISKRVKTSLGDGFVQESSVGLDLPPDVATSVLNARTKVAPFVDDEEATNLRELCKRIEESNGSDSGAVTELEETLQKYNYLF